MVSSGKLERRDGGFFLLGRRLTRMDSIDVDVPMVGWTRGRFGFAFDVSPIVAFVNGQVIDLTLFSVELRWPENTPCFTCPRCRRTTYNPVDVREMYCGACHQTFR
jgi:hypothetical protein